MRIKIFLLTVLLAFSTQAMELSKKEKECYASFPVLLSGIERFSPVIANYTSRLFFHLIEHKKLSPCEAREQIKKMYEGLRR